MRPHRFAVPFLLFLSGPTPTAAAAAVAARPSSDVVVSDGAPPSGGARFTRRMTPTKEADISAGGGSHQEEVVADISPSAARKKQKKQQLRRARGLQQSTSCSLGTGRSTYVSSTTGTDDTASYGTDPTTPYSTIQYAVDNHEPCETIHVMAGTYYNEKYGSGENHYKAVINLSGVDHLTIKAHSSASGDRPKLKFDGPGGIICNSANPCSQLDISGLEIEGPNSDITYEDAMANRNSLATLVKYTARGVAVWKGDRITLSDMVVHDCPGSGMRVNKGDYISITDSVVYDNTWWSPRAESAIVFAESLAVDEESNKIKMTIARNEVYGNVNKIPYYNPNYDWDYSPIGGYDCGLISACNPAAPEFANTLVDCPWQCRYGKSTQNYIIDGMGVYVTRNKDTYFHGQMSLEDNVCHGNGINGLVFHRTDGGYVRRNAIHSNGVVPVLEIPELVAQDWHASAAGKSRQRYSGLVLNNAAGVKLWSNNVAARYEDDYAFKQEDDSGVPAPVEAGGNNKVCRGLVQMDPASIVAEATDLSACGLPAAVETPAPSTPAPTPSPTSPPTVPPAFVRVACSSRCHLIQWPYAMRGSYPSSTSLVACESLCESSGDCRAFSLQKDYAPNAANPDDERCFLYKSSQEPNPAACGYDPFNTAGCWYRTENGRFYVRPDAKMRYNVLDVAVV